MSNPDHDNRPPAGGRLRPGEVAPDFELPDPDGRPVSLADYRGRRVIVYFYPKAFTGGCTREAAEFQAAAGALSAAGYEVIGVSRDSSPRLVRFRDDGQLSFPLLSDPEHQVHAAYGAWTNKTVDGVNVPGVLRSTFVIDADGHILIADYDVDPASHVQQLLGRLDAAEPSDSR